MTLTTEQIERILEDAPEGATHYESEYKYLKAARSGYMVFDTEGGDWDYEYVGICETHNLSDLRRILKQEATILTLRQRVKDLEAQLPKWISVEDELPDDPKEVLGLLSSGTLRICKYCQNKNIWMEAMSYERLYTVTHWMPQPPKEKDDE